MCPNIGSKQSGAASDRSAGRSTESDREPQLGGPLQPGGPVAVSRALTAYL